MCSHKPKDTQLKSREVSVWSSSIAYLLTAAPSHGLDPHLFSHLYFEIGLPRWFSGKEPACQRRSLWSCGFSPRSLWSCGFSPWVRKIPWRRKRQPTPVFLPGTGAWWVAVCGIVMSWTPLSAHTHTHTHTHTL